MGKRPERARRLGTYGERIGRERAARRRAARAKAEAGPVELESHGDGESPLGETACPAEPEIIEIPQSDLANELSVLAALIMSGLVRSHPEARRRFRVDGVSVNDTRVLSDKAKLRLTDVSPDGIIKLSLGVTQQVLLRPV